MMVVMMMVMVRNEMPDDAANDPVVVVMVMMMDAVMVVVAHTCDLHLAVLPADRFARRRRIGRPQRGDGVRNRIEQLGK